MDAKKQDYDSEALRLSSARTVDKHMEVIKQVLEKFKTMRMMRPRACSREGERE